jgi:hypothetical protein
MEVSLGRKAWVSRVGTQVTEADQQKKGPVVPQRRLGPSAVKTEAAVSGGSGGHGGSAWEVPKACRGPLRRRRHARYPLGWPVRAQPGVH